MRPAHALFLAVLVLCGEARAEPPKGGFFDENFVKEGYFDPTPAPKPPEAVKPTAAAAEAPQAGATPEPAAVPTRSQAVTANEIYGQAQGSIQAVRDSLNSPSQQQRVRSALEGVRQNVNQGAGAWNSTAPRAPEPKDIHTEELTVAVSADQLNRELSFPDAPPAAPELTLIVKAEPRANYLRALDRLHYIATKRGVKTKRVYVIGLNKDLTAMAPHDQKSMLKAQRRFEKLNFPREKVVAGMHQALDKIPASQLLLEKLNLAKRPPDVTLDELLQKHHILLSPVWIVEAPDGKQTTYQGAYDPIEFFDEQGRVLKLTPEDRSGTPLGAIKENKDRILTLFEPKPVEKPATVEPAVAVTRPIKDCTRSRVRKLLAGPATFGVLGALDVVLYSAIEPGQIAAAERYSGVALPYKANQKLEEAESAEPILPFLRSLPIRCLPTRVRYINEGAKQYAEYRQGEAAWVEAPAAATPPTGTR